MASYRLNGYEETRPWLSSAGCRVSSVGCRVSGVEHRASNGKEKDSRSKKEREERYGRYFLVDFNRRRRDGNINTKGYVRRYDDTKNKVITYDDGYPPYDDD